MHCSTRLPVLSGASLLLLSTCLVLFAASSSRPQQNDDERALMDFAGLHPIDVHVHIFKSDPAFQKMLEDLNLKVMDILVMDDTLSYRKQLQPQVNTALALTRSSHGHIALCTTFDPYKFENPSFTQDAITQINHDFAEGAIAVKIWKNIGMEIKDRSGKYIMADAPKFQLIYRDIADHGKTLMAHQAEPDVAWGPPNPEDPSWSYYQENPQWYLGDKKGFPSKQAILAARDRVLEQNPKLRVVGVHLGSMEKNLEDIAARLDKYPNFAIDMAGRMEHLMLMPSDKVRDFLIKYQDRVLYGTDLDLNQDANLADAVREWKATYVRDWKFLATDETLKINNQEIHGLKLPKPVLQKLFHDNAVKWIPGL